MPEIEFDKCLKGLKTNPFRTAVTLEEARMVYKHFARVLHPDVAPDGREDEATDATARLNGAWDEYKKGLTGGFEVTTKKRTYSIESLLVKDEIANIYPCSYEHDGSTCYGILRLSRSPKTNDLVEAEAKALKKLDGGEERFRAYAPKMVESFIHRDSKSRVDRRAVITERLEGFYSLEEIHDFYPNGIEGRDVAWMWRRMLAGIGWAHQTGMIHGAILPPNVLIEPVKHGVVFVNWSYSVPTDDGARIRALVTGYEDWYPKEVLERRPAGPYTDISMIARCCLYVLGDRAPVPMRAFAKGCMLESEKMRPQDAWETQREYDDLLERLYGKRKYRPFIIPV